MTIQIEKNGVLVDVTKDRLFEMARKGEIEPETTIVVFGAETTASKVSGLKFARASSWDDPPIEDIKPDSSVNTCPRCGKSTTDNQKHKCFENSDDKTRNSFQYDMKLFCIIAISTFIAVGAMFLLVRGFALSGSPVSGMDNQSIDDTEKQVLESGKIAESYRYTAMGIAALVVGIAAMASGLFSKDDGKKGNRIGCGCSVFIMSLFMLAYCIFYSGHVRQMTGEEWKIMDTERKNRRPPSDEEQYQKMIEREAEREIIRRKQEAEKLKRAIDVQIEIEKRRHSE